MRLVLDTNVLISAFLFGGQLTCIVQGIQHGDITPCFSYATWRELQKTLHYPRLVVALQKNDIDPADFLVRLELSSLFFTAERSPVSIVEDPADEAILACAMSANAKALVTGDRHILSRAGLFSIPILTPQQLRNKYFS